MNWIFFRNIFLSYLFSNNYILYRCGGAVVHRIRAVWFSFNITENAGVFKLDDSIIIFYFVIWSAVIRTNVYSTRIYYVCFFLYVIVCNIFVIWKKTIIDFIFKSMRGYWEYIYLINIKKKKKSWYQIENFVCCVKKYLYKNNIDESSDKMIIHVIFFFYL